MSGSPQKHYVTIYTPSRILYAEKYKATNAKKLSAEFYLGFHMWA